MTYSLLTGIIGHENIKDLLEANADSGFDLSNLWKISVTAVKKGESITFRNVRISSTDDERQYPFIKVNQVGYTVNGAKTARISYFAKFGSIDGRTYEIVDKKTGKTVLTGILPEAELNDHLSGESVHTISFDELKTPVLISYGYRIFFISQVAERY